MSDSAVLYDESVSSAVRHRVEAEFREMPGLTLTVRQAARLWGLDVEESAHVLSGLARDGFLVRNHAGAYLRRGCPRCA